VSGPGAWLDGTDLRRIDRQHSCYTAVTICKERETEVKSKAQVDLVSDSKLTGFRTFHETLTAVGATDDWPRTMDSGFWG
jgi:hypothetical protein